MKEVLYLALKEAVNDLASDNEIEIQISKPSNPQNGDWSSNIALLLSKKINKSPHDLAKKIIKTLKIKNVSKIEIAGAGFINFYLDENSFYAYTKKFSKGDMHGILTESNPKKILLEYVSSNPTGPIHVGHGRAAAFGSALANLYRIAGNDIYEEYYVNDRGLQAETLGLSILIRYQELFRIEIDMPEGGYLGDYIKELAAKVKKKFGDKFRIDDISEIKELRNVEDWIKYIKAKFEEFDALSDFCIKTQVNEIKKDLETFKISYNAWFYESSLYKSSFVKKSINSLRKSDTFESEGAIWFKSSSYGDEKDRVLIRENSEPTYFASDVAYHHEKFNRKFDEYINIWGADHHGYIPRIKASINSLDHDENKLLILLIQFVSLIENGKKVQMSTRSGEFVELSELVDKVGLDSSRYYFLARKIEQALEFDIDLAKKKDKDNHVYYIQYAHARICSLLKENEKRGFKIDNDSSNLTELTAKSEKEIIAFINSYPEILLQCYRNNEIHPLCFYLRDLSSKFHTYYNSEVIIDDNENLRNSRLTLSLAVKNIIRHGFEILKINCPDTM